MLYIAFEFSFIVMKMIWCRGPSHLKMQLFRAKIGHCLSQFLARLAEGRKKKMNNLVIWLPSGFLL